LIAADMQTRSERLSDTKKSLELCRHVVQSASLEVSGRILCSLTFGGAHQILTYVTELHYCIRHD